MTGIFDLPIIVVIITTVACPVKTLHVLNQAAYSWTGWRRLERWNMSVRRLLTNILGFIVLDNVRTARMASGLLGFITHIGRYIPKNRGGGVQQPPRE